MLYKRLGIELHKPVWRFCAVILFEGLLLAMAANWITIPSPLLATILAVGLIIVLPGWLLISLVDSSIHWAHRIGMAPAVSAGMWGLLGLVLISEHSNITIYLRIVVIITLALGVLFIVVNIKKKADHIEHSTSKSFWGKWAIILVRLTLLVAFCLVVGLFIQTVNISHVDRWVPEGFIRHYLDADRFLSSGFYISDNTISSARNAVNIWMPLLAVVIKLTYFNLFDIYSFYLPPVLIFLSCFSMFALAFELFDNANTALFVVLLQILYLSSGVFPVVEIGSGLKWLFRINEDKFTLWFMILPGVLAMTVRYLLRGRRGWLFVLGIGIFTVTLIHPLGLVFFGIIFGGYAIFEVILITIQFFRIRKARESISKIINHPLLKKIIWLSFILVFLLAIPILQRKYQSQAISDVGRSSTFFEVSWSDPTSYIESLGNGNFRIDPSVLDNQFIILALVVTPWLVFRGIKSFSARFLAAGMIVPLVLVFSPVAPFVGSLVTVILLWRLLWIMPVAFVITFAVFDFIQWIHSRRIFQGQTQLLVILPLMVWVVTIALIPQIVSASQILWNMNNRWNYHPASVSIDDRALFEYLRKNAEDKSTIFANQTINDNIPGLVGRVYGVTFFDYPPILSQTNDDLAYFFSTHIVTQRHLEILSLHQAQYRVRPTDDPLTQQFASLKPAFLEIYENNSWSLFKLNYDWETFEIVSLIVKANDMYQKDLYEDATQEYTKVLALDSTNFWASNMLGNIYLSQGHYKEALVRYENAVRIKPDAQVYEQLGDVLRITGEYNLAECRVSERTETEARSFCGMGKMVPGGR